MLEIEHPTSKYNFSAVTMGDLKVWFSYSTPIAFNHPHTGLVTRMNEWGPTTGRHLSHVRLQASTADLRGAVALKGDEFLAALDHLTPQAVTA